VTNIEVVVMEVDSTLPQNIRKGQLEDEKIQEIKHNIKEEKSPDSLKMSKVYYGTKEGFVYLLSRS
jgi:hypothetical protein